MNITVINIKDIIKYLIFSIVLFIIIFLSIKVISNKEELKDTIKEGISKANSLKNSSFLYCLKTEIPVLLSLEETDNEKEKNSLEDILKEEISMMNNAYEIEEGNIEIAENTEAEENVEEDEEESTENVETEVIDEHNITASYTDSASSVKINNQTSFDISSIISNPSYELENKNKVIIYHTHTCESYTSSSLYSYDMTGNYRTTDLNYTVSRVGDELANYLTSYGKTVIHDTTYHDYPSYNGSYSRSLTTLTNILESNSDAEIAIDLHRDAVGSSNEYGPTVKIGDEVCAQIMFVIGTNGSRIISS